MGCEEVSPTTLIYLVWCDVSTEDMQLKHLLFHLNLVIKMKINAPLDQDIRRAQMRWSTIKTRQQMQLG